VEDEGEGRASLFPVGAAIVAASPAMPRRKPSCVTILLWHEE
jgi:hypothetical protein